MNAQRHKYGRTYHLPWSMGRSDDDKVLGDISHFVGAEIVCTEKFDGENSSLYHDGYTHARSVDSAAHESRDWLKGFWSQRSHELPSGWRVCGENLYAAHSIWYANLPSLFIGFSIWDDENNCLSWDSTLEWFELLGIQPAREWLS